MSLDTVRRLISERLDQADRGDRGWFLITRIHIDLWWLKAIATYLYDCGDGGPVALGPLEYQQLGRVIGITTGYPGIQLRRHHLLLMDKPLQLLQRPYEPYWKEVALTDLGRALAREDDAAAVLESSLKSIHFATQPWTPADRVSKYDEFNVSVYDATVTVLRECDGYIDRNEFDFFLSRIRNENEIPWAIQGIGAYRELEPGERVSLRKEVSGRIQGMKSYQNWRDVGLHTFSLFSLGTSLVRDEQRLLLTERWVDATQRLAAAAPQAVTLKMPEPEANPALLTPPAAPASNAGADAESFVAKVLRSQGWDVVFYTNRRGYGFDLWARQAGVAMVVEVKSSLGNLGTIELTPNEHAAAQQHGNSYYLALVENLAEYRPTVRMLRNPVGQCVVNQRNSTSYAITRAEWLRAIGDQ